MYFQTQTINGATELAAISPTKKRGYEKIQSITVIGRRWNDGQNTYHSTMLLVNGKCLFSSSFNYGYAAGYIQTAQEHLSKFIEAPTLWRWCNENEINFFTTCADVQRRKDL